MKKIFFMALLLFSFGSRAQVTLEMSQAPFSYRDTVVNGEIDTLSFYVKNTGTGTFNGQFFMEAAVRQAANPSQLDTTSLSAAYSELIPPGDSVLVPVIFNYTVSSMNYRYGIDVIVVWPIAGGLATIGDSLNFPVYIEDPDGINELTDPGHIIKVYPNPGTDEITVEDPEHKAVESIVIYDITGRAVATFKNKNRIDIHELAPGMYHVEVLLSDKRRYLVKFMKQKNGAG